MDIKRVGIVGWRGMVGSVLMERMRAEDDFSGIEAEFFTTSQVGQPGPDVGAGSSPLADAYEVSRLARHDAIVTCQGGDYTKQVLPQLREAGWQGYWIDAASAKRMDDDTVIVLDPVNRRLIDQAISNGVLNYAGGNCTTSLMLLALHGLFEQGWVEWLSAMTYQAASGAGAANMRELVAQMKAIGDDAADLLADPATSALALDGRVRASLGAEEFPSDAFGVPLAASLLPWIDSKMEGGETREEWKAYAEGNKILANDPVVPIDGLCVRVGAMRCHSQAFTVKLRQDVPLDEIHEVMDSANPWVEVLENDRAKTLAGLSPTAVTGTLKIPVGRIRKLRMGPDYLGCFTVGDQLLWGAAEPLRRVLRILREQG